MAKFTLTNAYVAINGTAISDHCSSVSIDDAAEEIDFTSFSSGGYREIGAGLKDVTISFTIFQDYAAANVYSILQPLYQSGGTFGVEVRPVNTTVSATNPKATMTGRLFSFNPIGGAVGDAATSEISIRNAGTLGLVMGTS